MSLSRSPIFSLTHEVRGLFKYATPVRSGSHRGVVLIVDARTLEIAVVGYRRTISVTGEEIKNWHLDLREPAGLLRASQYIDAMMDKLGIGSAHDLADAVSEGKRPNPYYGAFVGAGQGDRLETAEKRALAEIVVWISRRTK